MQTGRNAPCPCGSGEKYKRCCAPKGAPSSAPAPAAQSAPAGRPRLLLGAVVVLVAGGLGYGLLLDPAQPGPTPPVLHPEPAEGGGPGRVWSPEHGHWHTLDGQELPGQAAPPPGGGPGKVWSEEHGHWHDAPR